MQRKDKESGNQSPLLEGLNRDTETSGSQSKKEKEKEIASIHYVWVGPPSPAKTVENQFAGHDVVGPIQMADANQSNPIIYWCLDKHQSAFKRKLPKNVRVESIQSYIDKCLKSEDARIREMAQKMREILVTSLKQDKVRDRVTVKDAFTLFLHATQSHESMYTLDTNISPTQDKVDFPNYQKFMLPQLSDSIIDCWAMYSSTPNKEIPQIVFASYYDDWLVAMKIFKEEGYSAKFQAQLGHAIVTNLDRVTQQRQFYRIAGTWQSKLGLDDDDYDSSNVELRGLPIKKAYFNSHRVDSQVIKIPEDFNYKQLSERLQSFIINHKWELNKGGVTIEFSGHSAIVPKTVANMWQILLKANENHQYADAYSQINAIAKSALSNEESTSSKMLSMFNPTSLGKRSPDTREFLKKVSEGPLHLKEYVERGLDIDLKHDDDVQLGLPH